MQPIAHPPESPFGSVRQYIEALRLLAIEASNGDSWEKRCAAALDAEAGLELRRVIPIDIRREFGTFFTGIKLSTRLISRITNAGNDTVYYDPTCGMGDLLLAVAKSLPLRKTVHETLWAWGEQLSGTDLHSEFIQGAKSRLILLARQRHHATTVKLNEDVDYFPNIRVGDALAEQAEFERATCILMNPPFGAIVAPKDCKWGSGRITAAALFVISILERAAPDAEILAILPEVLRSGSFSSRWRDTVSDLAEVHSVEPFGIFDENADVDVFTLHLRRRKTAVSNEQTRWPSPSENLTTKTTIASFFNVHVGRVVPHRDDDKNGPEHPYIHARCVPTWAEMNSFSESRRHQAQAYLPPFVAIRRTSRPDQPFRATATVIGGSQPVFVENHLIVCEPKDHSLDTCRELMRQLRSEIVNEFLNARIRCRHLTVTAVRDIPFLLRQPDDRT